MGRGFKKSFALSLCIVIMLGVVLAGVLFETPAKAQSVIYSDWSEWSTTAVSATDSREVQTKTVSEYWRTRYDYDYYCTWHAGASAADAYEYSNTGGNWHFYVHDSSNPNNWWYYSVYSYTKNVQAYPAGYYMNVTPGQILSKANGQLPGSTAYMDYCKNSGNKTGYALRADQSGQEQGRNQIVFLVGSQDEYRDVTYYRYRTITKTYTVRFDANGGSGAPSNQTKIHGKTLTLSSTKPTRTGYTFNHWDAWPNGGGASYMPGGQFTYNDDSTLYAIWEPHTYTVSYNANGGTGAPSSQTKTYGVDLKLSNQIPTRTGYTFLGWSKSSTATTATYPYAGTYTDNAGATLYAVWQVKSYTLTYILSGEVYQTTTYNYGASVEPAPTPPERDNMTFAGWTTATPKIMPAYNVTIRGGYGLQFGSYPQSEVTDEETIELLNSKVNDGDWISYNYYSGTGVSGSMVASDYMEYVDLDIDGDGRNDYRGVVMHNFRPYKTYEAHTYNRQESNGYRNLEKVYWFSYDPLYWTVIDQETGLCVCDTIIDAQAFNNTMSSDDSKIDIDGSYVSDYKNSDIRIWLNNDFRNTAFTFTEKTFLTLSEVDNPKSLPINMGFATETFNDYVFLLSKEQIADANIPYVSKYCAIQGFCGYVDRFTNVNIQNTDNKNYCLTRTAYSKLLQLTDTVCISGSDPVKAYDASYGIRPAITMKLSALDSTTEYTLTYRLNGKIYAQETHRAGEVIVPIDEPEVPEGQYFSGWQPDVPYVMPIGDLTINGSIGMPFGSYPQSQVTDIDLIATLNNTVQQDDWTSYNYYSGTGEEGTAVSSDYMEYADIDIDNDGTNDYRGVILHQYRPTLTYNERDAGNSTQYANNFMLNEVYWFRYDPLYWIVISDEIDENEEKTGNSVLMCTSIIDSQPFVNVTGTDDFATSDMRTWLNNDFYNIAFTSSEKSRIVNADDNYVRLLSADEAFENDAWNSSSDEYDFCNSSRMGSRSSYAEAQGLDENRYALMDSFILESSLFIGHTIEANGKIGIYTGLAILNTFLNNISYGNNFCQSNKYVIYDTNIGVRPVITVNLTASTHTLTFVPNNGEENVVITANFGTPVTAPNDPEMAGYTFVGWDTEVPVTMPDEDLVITALWAANEYTVTYKLDGVEYFTAPDESAVDAVVYGTAVPVREKAVKEGYTCTDWEFTPALEDGKMPACNVVAESYSYINSYKVIWNYEVDCYEENYEFGEKITEYIPPEKEGYTFDGWTPEVAEKMPAYDLEYTALYTVNNYTITYNVDGELYDEKTYEFNSNVTKLETPVKAGFIFSGWDDCEPDKMPAYNITLNGSFHPAPAEYTVETYIMNTDGTYDKSSEVFNSTTGENVTAEYTISEGFALNTEKSILEGEVAADGSLILKVYIDRNRHNISFNDGTNTTTDELYYGDDINKPDDPEKEGYTFEGWSEDGETVVDVEETVPDRDIEYIAVWSINSYTITFKYGEVNDNAEYKTITEEFGKEIEEVADPEFTGYTFDGWDTDIPDTMPAQDITITALWTVIEHTVRFETNGGTPIDSIKVSHGEKADKPEAPQKQDFIFTGWYTDEELKKPFDFNTPVTDNITLYAKWSSVIEFGSYPQSQVTSESILSELNAMLTEDSWVSYGYYTGGEASDFMKYADVEYNGEKYRAVTFSEYRPSVTTNTPEFSYSANSPYQQYNGYDTDAVYWFRYDPLVWRVLDYDTGLLLCENIIDSQPYTQIYYEKGEFSFEFYNGTDYSNYANDYSSSFIRAWLNEDFLNTAFSSSQQKKIITSQLDCFGATSTYDSETTNDKIFLLSYDEVLNPDYGFASENEADAKRIAAGSDYAKCQVLWPNSYIGSTYTTPSGDSSSYWRLRTGGESSSISDIVGYDGAVSRNSKVGVTCTYAGIRPSLRTDIGTINSHTITFDTDGGTEIDPITQDYGTEITKPADPEKEGCTFDGWDTDIPDTMPDEDMTITALWIINEYSVTYKLDGADYFATPYESAVDKFNYGETVPVREKAVKEGYTVSDWAFTPALIDGKMPAGNVVANATSIINSYNLTVTYEMSDGKDELAPEAYSQAVEYGKDYSVTSPEVTGYTPDVAAVEGTMGVGDVAVTVKYSPKPHTVTWNVDGEKTVDEYVYGDDIIKPDDPTKEGYDFIGWSEDGETVVDVAKTVPDGDIEYIAVWSEKQYTVTYKLDGGKIDESTDDVTVSRKYTDTVDTNKPANPEKEGNSFEGWAYTYTDSDNNTVTVSASDTNVPYDITATALWTAKEYTVTYKLDGVEYFATPYESAVDTFTYGSEITVREKAVKEGYTVSDWAFTPALVDGKMPAGDVVANAISTVNKYTLTVNYVMNDGSDAPEAHTELVTYGAGYSVETPAVTGYTPDTDMVEGTMDSTEGKTVTVTYYVNSYKITYNVDGKLYDEKTYEFNADVTKLAAPEKQGYVFSGWDKDEPEKMPAENLVLNGSFSAATNTKYVIETYTMNLSGEYDKTSKGFTGTTGETATAEYTVPEGFSLNTDKSELEGVIAADSSLVLKVYLDRNRHNISFNDGTNTTTDELYYGDDINKPDDPEKEGYTFEGWSEDGETVVDVEETVPDRDIEYIAVWSINSYTITFKYGEVNDNAEYKTIIKEFGKEIEEVADPEFTGYTFDGWDTDIPDTMPAKDMTITALWSANEYKITYKLDGVDYFATPYESAVDTFTYGSEVTVREKAVKEGYTVSDWAFTPALVDGKMPAGDVVANATSTVNSYTVTYKVDGEQYGEVDTVKYEAPLTAREAPAKTGYTFSGWSDIPETMPAHDIVIEGTFSVNSHTIAFDTDGGTEIDPITQDYGTEITKPADPEKEGCTFDGWDTDIPDTMPDEDMTITAKWTVNEYSVTYKLDGVEYFATPYESAVDTFTYGSEVTVRPNAVKEGYTVSDWAFTPTLVDGKMPAGNVVANATSTVKSYTVTYKVDGVQYGEVDTVEFGAPLTARQEPEKDGYIFSGWSAIPETMPACNIEITGSFNMIYYTATFVTVNDDGSYTVVDKVPFPYGALTIDEPAVPERDNYEGVWEEYVPGNSDITVKAIYTPIDPNDNSEVITEKTVNSFDGKVASITLSASAASRVIKMESSSTKPVDVVLVLDLSGSMNDPLGSDTSTTKLEALKKCTVDFIKDLNSNAVASGADHRVALVSFASGSEKYANQKWENTGLVLTQDGGFVSYPEASSHYDKAFMSPGNITGPNQAIINAVNGFTASGATCTHCGLKMAESILAQNNGADREKVVILITDGTPTVGSEVKSEINASAPIAVTYAKNLKKSGVKLYTVGVSAYADENASFTNDEDGVKTRTNGFGNEEFISFDFNRFLNIVSSNYPDSSSMSNYGSKTNDGYYMPVTDTSRLGDIFTKILRSTVYKNLIFKRCNIVDTLSSDFVMTMEQENAFRASLKDEYGISDDDISVIRNEDGTTTVRVNKVPVIRTVENGATVYRASVTFNASLIETQAGSYETNTDDAYIEVQDETVGTFDKPEAVTLNSDRNIVVFKLNGEIYTVSEGDIGDEVVAPVSEFAAWNIPEGTVITGNYAEFEADEIVTDPYTVTWNIDGNLSHETYYFGQRINEPEVPEKEGFDFAFFSPSIPAVMPARNVTFTAVYKPKHVHSFKQTGFYGTCTEGLTIVSTCSCGEISEEKQPAAVHNFSAVVENISGNALTDTLVCETCGASERHTLEFSTVERRYGRTYIVDLTLEKSGTIIQPAEGSSVKIMIPWENQGYTNRYVTIYRVNENNVQTKYTPTFEDGYLVFYADHFSIYIIDETDESGNPVNNISFNEATCSLNGHSFEWKYNNDATSEADGTETEVCKNCGEKGETRKADGTKLSTDPGQNTEPEYRLPSSFKEKTAAYKTIVTVSVTLNDIPSDAKVIIDGKEADVNKNTYSMEIGQLKATKDVLIEVVKDGKILDSSTLTVKVESNFFSRLISFFANFLFNMFKWREVTVKF